MRFIWTTQNLELADHITDSLNELLTLGFYKKIGFTSTLIVG